MANAFAAGGQYRLVSPTTPQSFSDESDRTRLSAAALTAFKSLVQLWRLSGTEAAALIAVSPSTWDRMKRSDAPQVLNQDQLTRVSALIGILKGLRLLFVDDMPNRWPRLKNKGPIFNGVTPVDAMIEGGIPRMLEVRRHVDALRGGL